MPTMEYYPAVKWSKLLIHKITSVPLYLAKEASTKESIILYIYEILGQTKLYKVRVGVLGATGGGRRVMEMLCLHWSSGYTGVSFVQTHQTIHLKYVQHVLSKFYFSEVNCVN